MKRLLPLFPLAALLLTTMGVGPCDSKPLGSIQGCTYQGQSHAAGSSWASAGSACNDCACTSTGAVCSMGCPDASVDASTDAAVTCFDSQGNAVLCPRDGGGTDATLPDAATMDAPGSSDAGVITCLYQGKPYAVGTTFLGADGCNSCSCDSSGMVACTTKACASDGGSDASGATCNYGGKSYPIGTTIPAGDGCNTCMCASPGYVPCTVKACDTDGGTDAVTGCPVDGMSYPVGTTIPAPDGCNTCTCASPGYFPCTAKVCGADAAADGSTTLSCTFDATYTYGWIGGLTAFTDTMTLSPMSSYRIVRVTTPGGTGANDDGMCAPPLPACGSGDGKSIDVSIVMTDIADPTVQVLLSLTTTNTITLGLDPRPMDGAVFSFKKNGSAGFLVGTSCMGSTTNCTEPPAAVLKLKNDLYTLDQQQRLDPACAGALSMGQ